MNFDTYLKLGLKAIDYQDSNLSIETNPPKQCSNSNIAFSVNIE